MGSSLPPFNPAVTGVVVSNMAALQALNPASFPVVTTRGYYSPGDGGGGTYDQLSGTPTADGGAFIAASGGFYGLRYIDSIHARQYGCYLDKIHDDTAQLQALLTFCSQYPIWADLTGGSAARITSLITLKHPCFYEGGACGIFADTVGGFASNSGFAVQYIGNGSNAKNALGCDVRNLRIWGPQWTGSAFSYWPDITQPSVSQLDGLGIIGGAVTVSNTKFTNPEILGFRDNLAFTGANNYIHEFNFCHIGGAWRNGINLGFGSNSGERITFNGGTVFNCVNSQHTALGLNDTMAGAGNADVYFDGVSFDYNDSDFNISTTRIWIKGHMESNTNNPNVTMTFVAGQPWPEFHHGGGTMLTGGGVPPFGNTEASGGKPYWINVTNGNGGHYRVSFDSTYLILKSGSSLVFPQDLILGQEAYRSLSIQYSNGNLPAINYYSSVVVNGRFNQLGGNINGWTNTTDANGNFSYDSATTVGNSRSMKFVATSASTSNSQQILPFKAGDNILLRSNIKVTGYSAGSTRLVLYYYAGDGTTLIGSYVPYNTQTNTQGSIVSNTNSGGFASVGGITTVPAGTGKVVMAWEQAGLIANAWIGGTDAWKI